MSLHGGDDVVISSVGILVYNLKYLTQTLYAV